VTPFASPQTNTTPDGVQGQNEAVNQAANSATGNTQSLLSANTFSATDVADPAAAPSGSITDYLTQFFGNTNNTAAGQFLNSSFFSNSILNGSIAGGPFNPQSMIGSIGGFSYALTQATSLADIDDFGVGAATASSAGLASNTVGSAGLTGASAGVGHANLVGSMSVPPSWSNAASISPAQTAVPASGVTGFSDLGTSPAAGGPGGVAGPMGGAGRRLRRAIPRYGFRPVVMPRPPAAG
jgi:hypothetical protein